MGSAGVPLEGSRSEGDSSSAFPAKRSGSFPLGSRALHSQHDLDAFAVSLRMSSWGGRQGRVTRARCVRVSLSHSHCLDRDPLRPTRHLARRSVDLRCTPPISFVHRALHIRLHRRILPPVRTTLVQLATVIVASHWTRPERHLTHAQKSRRRYPSIPHEERASSSVFCFLINRERSGRHGEFPLSPGCFQTGAQRQYGPN